MQVKIEGADRIVYISREGCIDLAGAINILKRVIQEFGNQRVLYILEDARRSTLDLSVPEMGVYYDEIKKHLYKFVEVRHAIVLSTPFETAMGVIFQQMVSSLSVYSYACFSTEKAAKEWLKNGKYYGVQFAQRTNKYD